MTKHRIGLPTASLLALALAACGGDSTPLASIPAPPIASPPPTSPPPPATPVPPPIPAGPIGLQSDQPFASVSVLSDAGTILQLPEPDAVQIRYSANDGLYTVRLGSMSAEGKLAPFTANGSFNSQGWISVSSTASQLLIGNGPDRQGVVVTLAWPASSRFTYTSFGSWDGGCPMGCNLGAFAYGIPTIASQVPVSGSADFDGEVRGYTDRSGGVLDVGGDVRLSFDFGAGTLSGVMRPVAYFDWDGTALGDYVFRDTVFARGSTKFSGAFTVPGSTAPSSFQGSFTGPNAAELMAQWQAPYVRPATTQSGQMVGVWIARRRN